MDPLRMSAILLFLKACLILSGSHVTAEISRDFLDANCGGALESRLSGRLETSHAITYANKMDCDVTVAVPAGKRIILFSERYEIEEPTGGSCLDSLTIHDGPSAAAAIIGTPATCGLIRDAFNITSSSNKVTFRFKTDDSAVYRGFSFLYAAFTLAPCSGSQFACTNGMCMDPSITCDDTNQCGDFSDESHCTLEELLAEEGINLPLVLGCTLAAIIFVIILIIIIVKVYRWYKWKRFIKLNRGANFEAMYQYPVTDLYNRYDIGKKGRRAPNVKSYYSVRTSETSGELNGNYIDEM